MEAIMARLGININFAFVLVFATLIWTRLLAIVSVIPFLFGKPVPRSVRVGGALVLMAYAYPHLVPQATPEITENYLVLFALYLKEVFVGLCIGFGASMLFYGFEAAGRMIDNQRGVSLARVLIPQLGEMGSISGQFLFQLAIVMYLTLGGHLYFFKALYESYQLVPLLEFPSIQPGLFPLMNLFIKASGEVIVLSIQIAAPVIIAILIADIILGVANRVAPQINVWELGFNVRGYVGILMLFLSITVILGQIERYSKKTNMYTDHVIQMLKGRVIEEYVEPEKEEERPPLREVPRIVLPRWVR